MLAEETGATSAAYVVPYPPESATHYFAAKSKLLLENLKLLAEWIRDRGNLV